MIQKYPPNWLLPSVPNTGPHSGIFLYYVFSTCQRCAISLDGGVSNLPRECAKEADLVRKEFCSRRPSHLIVPTSLTTASRHPERTRDVTAQMTCSECARRERLFSLLAALSPSCFDFLSSHLIYHCGGYLFGGENQKFSCEGQGQFLMCGTEDRHEERRGRMA